MKTARRSIHEEDDDAECLSAEAIDAISDGDICAVVSNRRVELVRLITCQCELRVKAL